MPFPGTVLNVSAVATAGPSGNTVGTTFSGVNFGSAFSGRYLLACFGGSAAIGASNSIAVTIAGVSATRIAHTSASAVTVETFADIWIALVPTGASGTIAITQAGNVGLTLYSLNGLSSATPDDTATGTTSASLNVPGNGAVFGSAAANASGSTGTWTGLTLDANPGLSNNIASSQAHSAQLSAQTLSVTCSISGTIRAPVLAVASFH